MYYLKFRYKYYLPKMLSSKFAYQKIMDLRNQELTEIPDFIWNFTQLEELYLDFNKISIITEKIISLSNLKILSISSNRITILPKNIGDMINLQKLNLNNNFLITLPSSIGKLVNCDISFQNNPIIHIPMNVARMLYQKDENKNFEIIPDKIQKNIFTLLDDNNHIVNNYCAIKILNNDLLSESNKFKIIKYCQSEILFSNLKFSEIFQAILNRIIKHKDKNKIFEILNNKIQKFDDLNYIERIISLFDILREFYDDII